MYVRIFIVLVLILFTLSQQLSAQSNDVSVTLSSLLDYKRRTELRPDDTIPDFNSGKEHRLTGGISYTRYTKKDIYVRTQYTISKRSHQANVEVQTNTHFEKFVEDYSFAVHQFEIEAGRLYRVGTTDFTVGGGLGFSTQPSYKQTFRWDFYLNDQLDYSQENVSKYPSAHTFHVFMNTSIYFKLYKPLYLGLSMKNALTYGIANGDIEDTVTYYNSVGEVTDGQTSTESTDIKHLQTNFLDLGVSLRVLF